MEIGVYLGTAEKINTWNRLELSPSKMMYRISLHHHWNTYNFTDDSSLYSLYQFYNKCTIVYIYFREVQTVQIYNQCCYNKVASAMFSLSRCQIDAKQCPIGARLTTVI